MQRLRSLSLLSFSILASLCLSDTAAGQTPTLTLTDANSTTLATSGGTATLNFTALSGTTATQTLTVTASGATTIQAVVLNAEGQSQPPAWLRINGTAQNFFNVNPSGPMTVSANTTGLAQGTYKGTFTVNVLGATVSNQITVTVNLTVSGSSVLSANPSTLNFTALQGATTGSPESTIVQINSSSTALNYTVTGQTQQGNWLVLPTTTGVTGGQGFSVSVNPIGLSAGTYNGTITVQSTSTSDAVIISVTLIVSSSSSLTISPATPPPFLYQLGGSAPASQALTISSNGPTISFSVQTNASWLVPSSLSGTAGPNSPATINLSVNTAGLTTGSYSGTVSITPFAGNSQSVPVKLVVSNNPLLTVSTNSLTFAAPFGGQVPASKTVTVTTTGTGGAVGFSITSDQNWLTGSADQNFAQSGSPATITVSVNQQGLAIGNYTGNLRITPTTGDDYFQNVQVTLAVGTTTTITAGPPVLLFSFQTNQALTNNQVVSIKSTGQPLGFNVNTQTTSCGSNWLNASPSQFTTPASLTVSVNAPGLPLGVCTGKIIITPLDGNPLEVPVTVAISNTALLTISQTPGFGRVTVPGDTSPQTIVLGRTDPNAQVTFTAVATTQTGTGWLGVSPNSGAAPQNLTVFFNSAGLLPGIYGGQILISSPALPTQDNTFAIPVTLEVKPNVTVTVSPTSLSFEMPQGGAVPASKTLTLTNSGGTISPTYVATVNQACSTLIGVTPSSGIATGTLTVSVLNGATTASQNTYNCTLTLAYNNAATQSASIPVTLTITSARTINVPTTPLAFTYQMGQAQPASKTISLTSTGGVVQFTVGTTSTPGGWLATDTTSGNTPKDVVVSVNTAGLAVGTYNGSITITAPGVLANPATIPVTLTVSPSPAPAPLTITSGASGLAGAISPGLILTIKGSLLGPATPANGTVFSLNSQGRIDPTLAGVRVLFDGIPGTPIFVRNDQVNAIAPYEIGGRLSVEVVVEYQGIKSSPIRVSVADVTPSIFTANQQGFGPSAAVNQNGTINGPGGQTAPAPVNSIIAVYATGGGQTNPPSSTGGVAPTNQLLRVPPVGAVTATIGGLPAVVEFAGAAPGYVNGLNQFNIRIPTPPPGTVLTGAQPIVITINGVSTPSGPTVAIQ